MKVINIQGVSSEDSLILGFDGAFDPKAPWESELEPFFRILEEHAGEWMPDVVEGKRRRKYTRPAVWKALEEGGEHVPTIGLYRTKWPGISMTSMLLSSDLHPELRVLLRVKPLSFFEEAARCRQLVDMVRAWASRYPVSYASAHGLAASDLAGAPNFGRDMNTSNQEGFDQLYEVFWLNVFGPKLVQLVGRERMLSTPAWLVEELPNGSILMVLWPTVTDMTRDEARQAQARAFVHLRPDLDLDTVLRTLRERSAALAPVEPRFPPDLAPLLSRVVDRVAIHQRQRQIAEFNAYQPPEPAEWAPATSALPPDVADPEVARRRLGTLAEHLVALLHTKAPSVFKASPESLTEVDFQFWQEDFPRVFEREHIDAHAVPAIGAYLGEVLVRNLGGQWIPRKRTGESQVLVGNRVWFPFVRAWHYMRSCQSLLDFSLTQLYRVAERHRG